MVLGVAPRTADSYASARLFTTGNTMPPARAPLDGITMPSIMSVATTEYARPIDVRPNARMKTKAMRRPRPVLIIPRAMQKAASTLYKQGSSLSLLQDIASWEDRQSLVRKAEFDRLGDHYGSLA